MKLFKNFCLVFTFLTIVGVVYAAPLNQTITCNQDCEHVFDNYEGIVTLLLVCDETSGVSITGTLTVNGFTDSHYLICDDTPPTCTTILNPLGWTNGDTEAIVGDCSDDLSGCDYSASSLKTKTITEHNRSESAEISDNAGNVTICSLSPPSQIDRLPPASCTTVLVPSGWTNGTVDAVVSECIDASETGQDGKSGCDPDKYFSTTVSDGENGTSMAFDKAGNGKFCSYSVEVAMIDVISPKLDTWICIPSSGWTDGEVSCNYKFKDIPNENGRYSGLADIESSFIVDGAGDETLISLSQSGLEGVLTHSGSFVFNTSQNQLYTFLGNVFDRAGNEASYAETVSVQVDKDPPTIGEIVCTPNGWTNGEVNCSYELEDPNAAYNSGLDRLRASALEHTNGAGADQSSLWPAVDKSLGAADMVIEAMMIPFDEEQYSNYILNIKVEDVAGNMTPKSPGFFVKIDKTAPEISSIELISQGLTQTLSEITPIVFEADEEFQLKINATESLEGIDMSGIDWDASTIDIGHHSQPLNKSISALTGGASGIEFISSTQTIMFSEFVGIFEESGLYSIDLEIFDKAGNSQKLEGMEVTIVASEYDSGESFILKNPNCDGTQLADGIDSCMFNLTFKDRFENKLKGREVNISFESQDRNWNGGVYDLMRDEEEAFFSGLRFDSITADKVTIQLNNEGKGDFKIKSLVPSVEVIESMPFSGVFLMKETDKPVAFHVLLPEVDTDGSDSSNLTDFQFTKYFGFAPWVKASLSDRANNTASDPLQFSYGDAIDIHANLKAGDFGKDLPTHNLKVEISGFSPDNTAFSDIDLSTNKALLNFSGGAFSETDSITTHLNSLGGIVEELNVAFSSKVEYGILEVDGVTVRTIKHPGGLLGTTVGSESIFPSDELVDGIGVSTTIVSAIIIGADIEGQILTGRTDNFTYQEDGSSGESGITRMGNISATDIREEITQSAYELIRGLSETTDLLLTNPSFGTNNIKYFKGGTVTLSGTVFGKGTIVIENGNLLIDNDLTYNNVVTDSLGVILINSSTASHPSIGNIYIKPNVQNIVGTYFSDGGFMSVDNLGSPNLNREDDSLLENQLLLHGTLFTRNTLGGAMFDISGFLDPWGSTSSREIAQKYDLHFVRRYRQSGEIDSNIKGVAPNYNPYCVAVGTTCDVNKHAFVIRPDGKVKNMPPPGFSGN